ncbi:MAG: phospho-N-acetylmuramoyl-pentapeptide-transferase [Candidatus Sericytochromatia bacterium]|nr:phospho-N-acetylmuramoyl-pentapeptide-transferase [Candidatus Tanganyikabacteria bacterium]
MMLTMATGWTFLPLTWALVVAMSVAIIGGPLAVRALTALKTGQFIREEGPSSHQAKAGTPSLGGLWIAASALAGALPFMDRDPQMLVVAGTWLAFTAIGFLDDWLSLRRGRNMGLSARQKFAAQWALAAIACILLARLGHAPWIILPGSHQVLDLGIGYWFLTALLLVGFSNAVNLTDGLDGLAASTAAVAFLAVSGVLMRIGLPSAHPGMIPLAQALAGACLGFLWINGNPAKVFMGDTGSLGLGAALVMLAVLGHAHAYLLPIGIVFLAETGSVMLQVAWFKATKGRRIFKMSPLHHHFELGGMAETRVVSRFATVGVLGAIVALLVG